jgi:hypothetical protein
MTNKITIYEPNGKIIMVTDCPEGLETPLTAGASWVRAEADIFADYISNDTPTVRPTATSVMSATTVPADGNTALTLSGAPSGSIITVSGPIPSVTGTGNGTNVSLTFGVVGTYTVAVDAFPQLDYSVTINAT